MKRRTVFGWVATVALASMSAGPVAAQRFDGAGTVPAGLLLRRLDGVKRVLLIGAHPDDEDTRLLAALARGRGVETAYLALTRGEGGQNLVGPELWEGLGIIRTGELEAARRRDGGLQFFTRAFDYGYSKSAREALANWPRKELLRDVVWVIRRFRPQVVVTVFTGTPRDGHGQHQAAGLMAREAFDAAGDPARFPDQLSEGVEAWTPQKLYQVSWRRPEEATLFVETGTFDPLLGESYLQLAMESRSQHRSQDMGTPRRPGPGRSGVQLLRSRAGLDAAHDTGFFAGVDTTLAGLTAPIEGPLRSRVAAGLAAYRRALDGARKHFDGLHPWQAAGDLADGLRHLQQARSVAGVHAPREFRGATAEKVRLATEALLAAAGIQVDARATDDLVAPGEKVEVRVSVWNGGVIPVTGVAPELALPSGWSATLRRTQGASPDGAVAPNTMAVWTFEVAVPRNAPPSRLYYLRSPRKGAMYVWPAQPKLWGLPRDPPLVHARVTMDVHADADSHAVVTAEAPWRYVGVDKARGEFHRPVLIVPAVGVSVEPRLVVWPVRDTKARAVSVQLTAYQDDGARGVVRLEAPAGWSVEPPRARFDLAAEGATHTVEFRVTPSGERAAGKVRLRARATLDDGRRYAEDVALIDYPHIERAALFSPAEATIVRLPVKVADVRVGYIMGSGDDGFEAIRQLGVRTDLLDPERVRHGDFSDYDVLVLGIRAYETRPDVREANARLLDFVRAGGTLIVQYNKYEYPRGGYAPYPVSMGRPAPRVTDEHSPVRLLEPDSPVFTYPNRITKADFDGWVHERGLYFLRTWDRRYVPLLELKDFDEPPTRGALLAATLGRGVYVYAALSFFREFPAGVPGAYRLFANLLSLEGDAWASYLASRGGGS